MLLLEAQRRLRAEISRCRWFLRPGETWLTSIVPTTPPSVRNRTVARSSVTTARRSPGVGPILRAKAGRSAIAARDDGRGLRAHGRDPLARDELDEIAPVRADVGERARGAAALRVDAPVVVLGRRQPVLQVAAVDEAHGADPARGDARPGLEHHRVVAVDERHGRDAAGASAARRPARPRRRSSRAASRRRRACRPRAPPPRAARAGRSACRCGRRRRRPRRRPPRTSRTRAARRGRSAASRARSGLDAATPTTSAPARRAERTWTGPMKPVAPTTAARSRPRAAVRTAPRARPSSPRRRCRAGGRGSHRGSCAWPAR